METHPFSSQVLLTFGILIPLIAGITILLLWLNKMADKFFIGKG